MGVIPFSILDILCELPDRMPPTTEIQVRHIHYTYINVFGAVGKLAERSVSASANFRNFVLYPRLQMLSKKSCIVYVQ